MDQVRVTKPDDAIRTIETETHPRATMGPKRLRIDAGGHGPRINREGIGTAAAGATAATRQAQDLHTPEDWPVHGVFVAMLFGSMFWLGAGVSSFIWWLAT